MKKILFALLFPAVCFIGIGCSKEGGTPTKKDGGKTEVKKTEDKKTEMKKEEEKKEDKKEEKKEEKKDK